jgi:hypothetical protein
MAAFLRPELFCVGRWRHYACKGCKKGAVKAALNREALKETTCQKKLFTICPESMLVRKPSCLFQFIANISLSLFL